MNLHAQQFQIDALLQDQQRIDAILNMDSSDGPKPSYFIRSASHYLNNRSTTDHRHLASFNMLLVGYQLQHNNNLPIAFNDGSFIPNVGFQHRLSVGMKFKWKNLHIQIQPELIQAQNLPSINFEEDVNDVNYRTHFYWFIRNKVDQAFRMGETPIQKAYWGQSSIRWQNKSFALGISSENLWWGPGVRNSLLLTNHAPGFLHASFNSVRPIATKIGNFEFQAIYGILDSAIAPLVDFARPSTGAAYIEPKHDAPRKMAGYLLSWNPKGLNNFYVGLAGTSYFYQSNVAVVPSSNILPRENIQKPATMGSLFFRYAIPSEQAEVYFEFGRSGAIFAPTNIFGDTIATGYTVGFRKLFKLASKRVEKNQSAIMVGIELTKLQLPDNRLIFDSSNLRGIPPTNSWYTHPFIRQGYTHHGQMVGASIGPGSNSQTLHVSWVKGLKRLGIMVERVLHNTDFYQYHMFNGQIGRGSPSLYWTDIHAGLKFQWNIRNLLFNANYTYSKSLNYRWIKLDGGFADPSTLSDKENHQVNVGFIYLFLK